MIIYLGMIILQCISQIFFDQNTAYDPYDEELMEASSFKAVFIIWYQISNLIGSIAIGVVIYEWFAIMQLVIFQSNKCHGELNPMQEEFNISERKTLRCTKVFAAIWIACLLTSEILVLSMSLHSFYDVMIYNTVITKSLIFTTGLLITVLYACRLRKYQNYTWNKLKCSYAGTAVAVNTFTSTGLGVAIYNLI